MERLLPWLGLTVGSAGVGFGLFLYVVPLKRQQAEIKRRTFELRSVKNESSARLKELEYLKKEFEEIRFAQPVAEDGRRKTEMRVLKAALEDRLKDAGAVVKVGPRAVRVRFTEDQIFDGHGPTLSRDGQARLQALAEIVAPRATSVLISAPMGTAQPPKWVRTDFPSAADFSTARARGVLRVLLRAGVRADVAFAVVGGGGPSGDVEAPTLDVEIEPKG
jgi:flagellar motor protein MotB